MEYRVKWEIDVNAENVTEAARVARAAQRRPGTLATFFEVTAKDRSIVLVDLSPAESMPVVEDLVFAERRTWLEIFLPKGAEAYENGYEAPNEPERFFAVEFSDGKSVWAFGADTWEDLAAQIDESNTRHDDVSVYDLDHGKPYNVKTQTMGFYCCRGKEMEEIEV